MAVSVKKLNGHPIVLIAYSGNITATDAESVIRGVEQLLDEYGAPLYKVITTLGDDVQLAFDELTQITTLSSQGRRGSITDPDVITVVVGEHLLIDLMADTMRQNEFGGVSIPVFDSVEEALAYIHAELEDFY